MFLTVYTDRAQARYSAKELIGNGLERLGYLSESKLVTRRFKNLLKSCGIFRPAYVDKAVLQFGKTEYRFDPGKSNNVFKYEHFKRGGTLAELRTFPKRPYKPVVGYRDQSRKGRLTRAHRRLPGAVVWKPKRRSPKDREAQRAKRGGNGPRQSVPGAGTQVLPVQQSASAGLSKRRLSRLVRAARSHGNGEFVTLLGGVTLPFPPPKPAAKKYWYFYRKRGEFAISAHHPTGDEYDTIRTTIVENYLPPKAE